MIPLLLYMIKAAFCLATFYLFYIIFLDRDTLYRRNRLFLQMSLAASLILPVIIIPMKQTREIRFPGIDLSGIKLNVNTDAAEAGGKIPSSINIHNASHILYLSGVDILAL